MRGHDYEERSTFTVVRRLAIDALVASAKTEARKLGEGRCRAVRGRWNEEPGGYDLSFELVGGD